MQWLGCSRLRLIAMIALIPVLAAISTGCPMGDAGPSNGDSGDNGEPPTPDPSPPKDVELTVLSYCCEDFCADDPFCCDSGWNQECAAEQGGTVEQTVFGSKVTLTALSMAGWKFVGWFGSTRSADNPLTIVVRADTELEARFKIIPPDADLDGVPDDDDICPGFDDAMDSDGDSVPDGCDNCVSEANPLQSNSDTDKLGDLCDNCAAVPNNDQGDNDEDGLGNACDECPDDAENDSDNDGVCGDEDQCPNTPTGTVIDAEGCPRCGNFVVDSGEQCDPPDGGTCNDECGFIPPDNDDCEDAKSISGGSREISNKRATNDGPSETGECNGLLADVWYCYTATCGGTVTIDLCDADFDTMLVVYDGCTCPPTTRVTCSDDDCGQTQGGSLATFSAESGEQYLLRIGDFNSVAEGDATLNITCDTGITFCTNHNDCDDDGAFCNGTEICDFDSGVCGHSGDPCDDDTQVCDELGDICRERCIENADCDNGDACDGEETCHLGVCADGITPDCDDGDACTVDSCDSASGCQHTDVICAPTEECNPGTGVCEAIPCDFDDECDDDNVCNGVETCIDGGCAAGTALDCDDADNCTTDSCDPVDGCSNVEIECGSGQRCNPDTGECEFITCDTAADCDDGIPCTIDICGSDNRCRNPQRECDDGNFCNGLEYCHELGGICVTPGNPCTEEPFVFCDDIADQCIECFINANCDDGLDCNGTETCFDGFCQAGTPVDCDDGVSCTEDTCNEGTLDCTHTPNDDLCPQDSLFCNGAEVCDLVLDCVSSGDPCEPSEACNEFDDRCDECSGLGTECDDGIDCSVDSCVNGQCQYLPINGACDNGVFCDGSEVCDLELGCRPGGDPCDDDLDCTFDECAEASQSCTHTADDDLCVDDGLFCNGPELCDLVMGCMSPGNPCLPTELCNDETDTCEPQAMSWESDQLMLRRDNTGFIPPEWYDLDELGDLTVATLGLSEAELQSTFPAANVTVHTTDVTLGVETHMYSVENIGGSETDSRSLHVTIDAFNLSVTDDGGVLTATWTFDFTGRNVVTDLFGTTETAWEYSGTRTGEISIDGTVIDWTSVEGTRCNVTAGFCSFPIALSAEDFPPGTWTRQ